ncbi:hypothetical protein [Comamonas sp. 26]|uniref:hypothetical protein n=1 Tax=Comamonas sp. 26 TaxID=2035201 RepID=UPI00119823B3|nr:hypothetical protein [Comamonas sp. 26]
MNLEKLAVVAVIFLIIGIWLGAWWWVATPSAFIKTLTSQPLADTFSSVNALFAGLACAGVLVTIYLQMRELAVTADDLKKTAEANTATARAISDTASANGEMAKASLKVAILADERSVLDLFQVYCSQYFQEVKNSSMSVLIPCAASKEYFDFVVSRFFVAEQLSLPPSCWERVSKVTYSKSYEEFIIQEQNHRYKLDELINFFTILTGRENAREIILRCDFSYSWWRPLFWMIASQQERRFIENPRVRVYATPLYFIEVVKKLDEIYGFQPFSSDVEMWDFIINHPKIKSYHLDPLHGSDLSRSFA